MEKEFEALKKLEWLKYMESICKEFLSRKDLYMRLNFTSKQAVETLKEIDIIKQALTELKQIKEAKPSEALENLKSLDIQVKFIGILDIPSWEKYLPNIKQALLKAQEQENDRLENQCLDLLGENIKLTKILSIIKEKDVDINYLRFEAVDVKQYNDYIQQLNKVSTKSYWCLTQEEFELLKRWCEKCQK